MIATAPQERSATHTASYTANLAALALIAVRLGEQTGADVGDLRAAVERLPESIRGHVRLRGAGAAGGRGAGGARPAGPGRRWARTP